MGTLYAGVARVKLEPPLGLAMVGYGARAGRASGVHDDLAAQALVLSDGAHKAVICGVDLLALGLRICADVCARVAARSDIPAGAILIGATHTHSGPLFNIHATPGPDSRAGDERNLDWERALPDKIASAIVAANSQLEPVAIKAASGRFTLGTNRRLRRPDGHIQLAANYAGVADAEAKVLGVYRRDGRPLVFVMNYPCHGVVLCEDNLLYSRDWMGFAMDEIERAGGAAEGAARTPIAIFLQGATGNIDPRFRGSFEVAAEHGRAMARALLAGLATAPAIESAEIATRRIDLHLKLKDLDGALQAARDCAAQTETSLKAHRGDGFQLKRLRDHHDQSIAALRMLEVLDEQNRRDRRVDAARGEMATQLLLITLGDIALVGIPGEPFVEFGLALKSNPYFEHTFVVGYANDLIGYIPTREAYPLGGYEVDTARIAEGSGELIVAAALAELRRMRGLASDAAVPRA
jgi:Neutral/alkaline non-lysosomal ceramidase, N-terminal